MADEVLAGPDLGVVKARQQGAWAAGDYSVIGSTILLTAELLCEAMDVRTGWRALDVAAGNGNMTLGLARRGCEVTSTDYVPALLERGRARVDAEGWRVTFQEADAEALPFADEEFDAVASTFGVMFAPRQEICAAELMRVCRVGGVIGLASWTPASFVGEIFRTIGRYMPPPAGVKPPSLWGDEARVRELFAGASEIRCERKAFKMRAGSVEDWLAGFRKFYGPMNRTFAALDAEKQGLLAADLLALAGRMNIATDGTMVLPSEYLEVVITR